MKKEFNDVGLCVANRHYMVDTSSKIAKILDLIEQGKYFTINRPRQFGKTTTLSPAIQSAESARGLSGLQNQF